MPEKLQMPTLTSLDKLEQLAIALATHKITNNKKLKMMKEETKYYLIYCIDDE